MWTESNPYKYKGQPVFTFKYNFCKVEYYKYMNAATFYVIWLSELLTVTILSVWITQWKI